MAAPAWYRLDNVGKFYSAQAGNRAQTVFRLAATMTEDVDPEALQHALGLALQRFPGFNVRLRSGFFWRYLVPAPDVPRVKPEELPICFSLHTGHDSDLIRVTYRGRRVNLEISHIIADGRGGLELLKALVGYYVEHRYGVQGAVGPYEGSEEAQSEDSFTANYEPKRSGSAPTPKPYRLHGIREEAAPTFFEFHISASSVRAAAKDVDASVTSLVIAAVIIAVRRSLGPRVKNATVRMDVPVDLRRYYGSATLRNFFGLAFVTWEGTRAAGDLGEVARGVQEQLSAETEPDAVARRMNRMVKLEKNLLSRAAPLFLKDLILELGAWLAAREVTTSVSSLGRVTFPEGAAPYVEGISALTATRGLNFIFATYGDDLCIGVSSVYVRHAIMCELVRLFASIGITGYVNTNKDDREVREELRAAWLEELAARSLQEEAPV